MAIKSLAQTLKDLTTGIRNTVTDITSSNATLTITKGNGTTSTVTVNNVANATNATKATQDSAGQQINTTYIKDLSVSGKTITYTRGNNTTGTITTQDTVYTHPNSGVSAGTYKSVTVNAQGHVTGGSNPTTLSGYGITDAPTKTGSGASGTWGINISGKANTAGTANTATKATQDSAGQQINTTYIKGLSISNNALIYTKGNGTTGNVDLIPAGTVQMFAGNTIPAGWLLCDGSAVSRTDYAKLFSAIGTTWGAGDGSTTFNLPNTIGRFAEGAATSGSYKSAGLPNITGQTLVFAGFDSGAFRAGDQYGYAMSAPSAH